MSDYRCLKDSKRKTATGIKMKQMDPVTWAQNCVHAQEVSTTHNSAAQFVHWHPPTYLCLGHEGVMYKGADKFLAQPTSRCILFDGLNISIDANLLIYIYIHITNIPPIVIINRINETQNLLSL
jgi:hypothetical protein